MMEKKLRFLNGQPITCSVPVLLREEDDGKVTFVGEGYVQGFMDGEAVAVMKAGKIEKKEWRIS
jgi:hypothetical protein